MPSTWQGGADECQIIERLVAFFSRIALKHAKSAEGFNDEELDVHEGPSDRDELKAAAEAKGIQLRRD